MAPSSCLICTTPTDKRRNASSELEFDTVVKSSFRLLCSYLKLNPGGLPLGNGEGEQDERERLTFCLQCYQVVTSVLELHIRKAQIEKEIEDKLVFVKGKVLQNKEEKNKDWNDLGFNFREKVRCQGYNVKVSLSRLPPEGVKGPLAGNECSISPATNDDPLDEGPNSPFDDGFPAHSDQEAEIQDEDPLMKPETVSHGNDGKEEPLLHTPKTTRKRTRRQDPLKLEADEVSSNSPSNSKRVRKTVQRYSPATSTSAERGAMRKAAIGGKGYITTKPNQGTISEALNLLKSSTASIPTVGFYSEPRLPRPNRRKTAKAMDNADNQGNVKVGIETGQNEFEEETYFVVKQEPQDDDDEIDEYPLLVSPPSPDNPDNNDNDDNWDPFENEGEDEEDNDDDQDFIITPPKRKSSTTPRKTKPRSVPAKTQKPDNKDSQPRKKKVRKRIGAPPEEDEKTTTNCLKRGPRFVARLENGNFSYKDIEFSSIPYEEGYSFKCHKCLKIVSGTYKQMKQNHEAEYARIMRHIRGLHYNAFQCPTCSRPCTNTHTLRDHMRSHESRENPCYTCEICERPILDWRKIALRRHLWTHKSEDEKAAAILAGEKPPTKRKAPMKQCDLCGELFAYAAQLHEHMIKKHGDDNQDDNQGEVKKPKKKKTKNIGWNKTKKKDPDSDSDGLFGLSSEGEEEQVDTGDKPAEEEHDPDDKILSEKVKQYRETEYFFTEVETEKRFKLKCESCPFFLSLERFSFRAEAYDRMTAHIKNHQKIHKCKTCLRTFPEAKRLRWHMWICHSKPNAVCPTCDRPFKLRNNHKKYLFARHVWSHYSQEEKEEKKRNGEEEPLKPHPSRGHFQCDVCGRSFSFKNSMDRHQILVHKKQSVRAQHECPHCRKWYNRLDSLEDHITVCPRRPLPLALESIQPLQY